MTRKLRLLIVGIMALMVAAFALPALAAPVTGAIFTTTVNGDTVNGNIYESKDDVYLNGGPQPNAPCSAAGLPQGDYYFQVTDPSGSVLLSTDTIEQRKVTVANGVITAVDDHATGTGKCGSLSAKLMPFDDTPNPGGEYKVWMTPVGSYDPTVGTFGFLNSQSKTDNFKVRTSVDTRVAIVGNKFYDANANGTWDKPSEPGIAGWRIYKQPPVSADQTDTTTSGQYSFLVDKNSGLYNITEGTPSTGFYPTLGATWINTTPISGNVTVADADVTGPDFGNVCIGAGGGLTLGFWSNPNGQNLITSNDLTALRALNLRNANGSAFDPTTKAQVKTWLLSANANNMANMLSAQLAAMKLNVLHGFVNGTQPVYAQGIGFITINQLMSNADASLLANGYTVAAGQDRTSQEQLKTALDKANNNLNFVLQPSNGNLPCAVPDQWSSFPPTS